MNDPHVVALYYSVRHTEDVDYDKAGPLSHDTPSFTVRIENGRADITMISHHATEAAALAEVEPFLRAWELTAALQCRPGEFELAYDRAIIVDRNPTPGSIILAAPMIADADFFASAKVHVGRSKYPDPPPPGIARDVAVELMFERLCRYLRGATTLADAGYFCLTVLEMNSSDRRRGRASRRYAIDKPVLDKLGGLTANKGGNEARKAAGANAAFAAAERHWIEETMKRLILRAAEVAGNPTARLPLITMACLPPLP
jgi:hypothetical protein